MINNLTKNIKLPGGVGDNTPTEKVDPNQLSIGIQIEMEHTNDVAIAQEIAMDHLTEDPEYYTKLVKAGLAKEFRPSTNSGFGDPDQSFNDAARLGKSVTAGPGNNIVGTIGGTSDGHTDGRNSEPLINKTIDIELESKKKSVPNNSKLWSRAKALAKAKFDVYPSAYANAWVSKWYQQHGGDWHMSEIDDRLNRNPIQVLDGPEPAKVSSEGSGTFGSGYDFVGYAENKTNSMKQQKLKEIIKRLALQYLREQEEVGATAAPETPDTTPDTEAPEVSSGESVTLTLDRDTAQKLHDLLMQQLQSGESTPPVDVADSEVETDASQSVQTPGSDVPFGSGEGSDETAIGEITHEESKDIGEAKKKFIQKAIHTSKKGALHKQLDVPQGEKIPVAKLAAAAKKGGKLGQRARLAQTLSKLRKKKK
jgi:hypothetical protein